MCNFKEITNLYLLVIFIIIRYNYFIIFINNVFSWKIALFKG